MKVDCYKIVVNFLLFLSTTTPPLLGVHCHRGSRPPPGRTLLSPDLRCDSEPQQVHISLAGNGYIRVSWVTVDKMAPSIVEYGKIRGKYEEYATGDYFSYHYYGYNSGKIHYVTIGLLEPSTTYYYRCSGLGPEFSMRTPPSSFPLEFAIVGDLGQTEWTVATLDHASQRDYDAFLVPGGLSYANGHQPLWDSFGRLVELYASQRPWMVTQGYREVEATCTLKGSPQPFKAYNARWLMPYHESGSPSNLFYSFDIAGAHFIMLASYADYDTSSAQYKWVQSDLAGVNRTVTPWVFVVVSAPWYSSNVARKGEGECMRKAMEKLLYNARVDVVFSAQVNAYERFTRVYDNKADSCGPVYITVGDGGNKDGLNFGFEDPTPSVSMYRDSSFGHGRLRLYDNKKAHWTWYRTNDDTDASPTDELWLKSLSMSQKCMEACTCKMLTVRSHDEL